MLNAILAATALLGGVLVARAFLPNLRANAPDPLHSLATAMMLAACAYFLRSAYWDIIWLFRSGGSGRPGINTFINLIVLLAEYYALRARLLIIPESERHKWSILTAPFYPKSCLFWRKRK